MCGIFGVRGHPRAAALTHLGLYSLQHRGQESAGIAAIDEAGAAHGVKRMGLDLMFTGKLARALGLRDVVPAPRHRLLFGMGGEQHAPDLTGWGFATLTPAEGGLIVQFFDPAREAPIYSALLSPADAGDLPAPPARD